MNKTYLLAIAAALVAAPMAFAHTDGGQYGTPKTYCENLKGDQNVHDYAVNGVTGAFYLLSLFVDGNTQDCDGDGVPGDFDGHSEWALGGAWLLATDVPPAPGLGATNCFNEAPHHPEFPTIWVFDHFWPNGVQFVVGVDTVDLTDPTGVVPTCGDGLDDNEDPYCIDHCTANFRAGLDGAYHVYVVNTGRAHIHSKALNDDPMVDDGHIAGDEEDPDHVHCEFIGPDPITLGNVLWLCVHEVHVAQLGHVYT